MVAVLKALAQPYALLLLAIGIALWLRCRRLPEGEPRRRWLWIPYLLLWLVSTPAIAYFLRGTLEWQNPPLTQVPDDIDAIVVLGGSIIEPGDLKIPPVLNRVAVTRTLQASRFYHRGSPCPVLASAGPPSLYEDHPACADLMGKLLEDLGVEREHILVETQSTTTYENAIESARILGEKGYRRIVLVTDATHLPRAVACFRKQGLEVVPGGCYYLSTRWRTKPEKFVPKAAALANSAEAAHEWLGLLWYWIRGRI